MNLRYNLVNEVRFCYDIHVSEGMYLLIIRGTIIYYEPVPLNVPRILFTGDKKNVSRYVKILAIDVTWTFSFIKIHFTFRSSDATRDVLPASLSIIFSAAAAAAAAGSASDWDRSSRRRPFPRQGPARNVIARSPRTLQRRRVLSIHSQHVSHAEFSAETRSVSKTTRLMSSGTLNPNSISQLAAWLHDFADETQHRARSTAVSTVEVMVAAAAAVTRGACWSHDGVTSRHRRTPDRRQAARLCLRVTAVSPSVSATDQSDVVVVVVVRRYKTTSSLSLRSTLTTRQRWSAACMRLSGREPPDDVMLVSDEGRRLPWCTSDQTCVVPRRCLSAAVERLTIVLANETVCSS